LTPDDAKLNEFSRLVGTIYDAAVDPAIWPAALQAVRAFVDAETAAFTSYDVFDRTPPVQFHVGYDAHWMQVYLDRFYALNPYMDLVARLDSGEAASSSARPDYPDLLASEFYTGWLKPQGLVDGAVMVVEKSMNSITTLVCVRNERQGAFDEAAMDRVGLLYPHLRRAVLIGRAFDDYRRRRAEDAAVLDSLAGGMFLLGPRGEIRQVNAAGRAMLGPRSALRAGAARLELASPAADRALCAALAAARDGEADLGLRGVSIPASGEGEPDGDLVLHLLPLNAGRQPSVEAGDDAAFVLFAKRIDRGDLAAIATFAGRFGLTPKEAEVLRTVVEVGGVPPAADVLGLSAATVRTHVTAIFDKSGVRRQADLIRLLMEMKSPFAR